MGILLRLPKVISRLVAFSILLIFFSVQAHSQESISGEPSKEFIDGLFEQFLFDPTGAERVRIKTTGNTAWAESREIEREGWLVAGKKEQPARVYFTDGESMSVIDAKNITRIDFLASCQARFAEKEKLSKEDKFHERRRQRMHETAIGVYEESDLAIAAWLYRLGHKQLALQVFAQAQEVAAFYGTGQDVGVDYEKMVSNLKSDLAWSAFARMVHAYMIRADEEALAHSERLLRLYPEEAKEYKQAQKIIAELKRYQKKKIFAKPATKKRPKGFETWSNQKKIAFLLNALEEVDVRQMGQPSGVDLASDWRVKALVVIGDEAVPALIAVIENDKRLTRSVHYWRDFSRDRTVLAVREAALTAVMSILHVQFFEPESTGDNFTTQGEEAARKLAKEIRTYWSKHGSSSLDERMMKVLTDPEAEFETLREAAHNLANLGEKVTLGTTVWTKRLHAKAQLPNPAVLKFSNPTAAEAILAAMDRDLAKYDLGKRESYHDFFRREIEDEYLFPLIELGDKRIAQELAKRCQRAKTIRMRRKWAFACNSLGDPKPLNTFAREFQAGKLVLPPNNKPNTNDDEQPGNLELLGIISYLAKAGSAEADKALYSIAEPNHPYHRLVATWVIKSSQLRDSNDWFSHPYCLAILRNELDNIELTGETYQINGEYIQLTDRDSYNTSRSIPEFLVDPDVRNEKAQARAYDRAATQLQELVFGLPNYHPLLKDADKKLEALKAFFDRFEGRYRRMDYLESMCLDGDPWSYTYIPDISPLGRLATQEDVKTNNAVFSLDGKGRLVDLKLPAVAIFKRDEKKGEFSKRLLIVQAEADPENEVTYGIIGAGELRAVKAEELTDITPIDELKAKIQKE